MGVGLHELPRADVVEGRWHIEMRQPVRGFLFGAEFRDGRTVKPVPGLTLRHAIASNGRGMLRAWRLGPDGEPDLVIGEPIPETPDPEPAPLETLDKSALVDLAEAEGVEIDKRWGRDRLLAVLTEHFDAAGDGDHDDEDGTPDPSPSADDDDDQADPDEEPAEDDDESGDKPQE